MTDLIAAALLAIAFPYVWTHRADIRTGRATLTGALILTAAGSVWTARTGQIFLTLLILTTGAALLPAILTDPTRTGAHTVKSYLVRVKPKGALLWREKSVALHDPTDPAALIANVSAVIRRQAKAGDQIEVRDGSRIVTRKFTVS